MGTPCAGFSSSKNSRTDSPPPKFNYYKGGVWWSPVLFGFLVRRRGPAQRNMAPACLLQEVVGNNAWLTYGMPLHRLREWGSANKLFDLIDETKFTPSQVRDMVALVFGKDACRQLPLPEVDLHGFIAEVELLQKGEPMTWCPLTKRCTAWFIPHKLRSLKSGGSGGSKLRRAWRSAISKVRGEIKGSKAK